MSTGGAIVTLSQSDRAAIRHAGEVFVQHATAKPRDDHASAACYQEDAIMVPPGHAPVVGRAAIEVFLSNFPEFGDYRLDVAEIEGEGGLAYERGTASMLVVPPEGMPSPLRINYLIIWRCQADGSWKIAREIFTPAATTGG